MLNRLGIALSARIEQAFQQAAITHHEVPLLLPAFTDKVLAVFESHFGNCPTTAETECFFSEFHLVDLYLASACASGSEAAWNRFYNLYRSFIGQLALYCCGQPDLAQEVADRIVAELCLPNRRGQCRLASYDGRVAIASWLDAIVRYRAINEQALKLYRLVPLDGIEEIVDRGFEERLQTQMRTRRYEAVIKAAMQAVLDRLNPSERALLLLRYGKQVSLAEIAKAKNLSVATVSRQVTGLCRRIRQEVLAVLATSYGLAPSVVAECVNDLLTNGDYSVLEMVEKGYEERGAAPAGDRMV